MVVNKLYKAVTIVLLSINLLCGQTSLKRPQKDTLVNKDFSYLFKRINGIKQNKKLQQVYLKAFLANAKAGSDLEMLINAYKNFVDHTDNDLKIVYADSMVYIAKQSNSNKLIGSSYLSKGIAYYGLKKHEQALENYLIANRYISKANDDYLTYKLKYNVAHEKYYLNQCDEAIALFRSCLEFFRGTNDRAYLNTLHSLGLCYNKIGDYAKSEEMVNLGLAESKRLENHSMDTYFLHLDGVNSFFMKNYASSIQKLKAFILDIESENDYANIAVANFYIGKSYWAMKKYNEGLPFLKRVDETFLQREYIRPDLRENYELLIQYYKNHNEPKQVLMYVDRILRADSILQRTHDYLYDEIHKKSIRKSLSAKKQVSKNNWKMNYR